jgi:hypothetical protein
MKIYKIYFTQGEKPNALDVITKWFVVCTASTCRKLSGLLVFTADFSPRDFAVPPSLRGIS